MKLIRGRSLILVMALSLAVASGLSPRPARAEGGDKAPVVSTPPVALEKGAEPVTLGEINKTREGIEASEASGTTAKKVMDDIRKAQGDMGTLNTKLEEQLTRLRAELAREKVEIDAEQKRIDAKRESANADQTKLNDERKKLNAEQEKINAEKAKGEAEQAKVNKDQETVNAEPDKVKAEREKVKADQRKINAEQDKVNDERKKLNAEQDTVDAEQDKLNARQAEIDARQGEIDAEYARLHDKYVLIDGGTSGSGAAAAPIATPALPLQPDTVTVGMAKLIDPPKGTPGVGNSGPEVTSAATPAPPPRRGHFGTPIPDPSPSARGSGQSVPDWVKAVAHPFVVAGRWTAKTAKEIVTPKPGGGRRWGAAPSATKDTSTSPQELVSRQAEAPALKVPTQAVAPPSEMVPLEPTGGVNRPEAPLVSKVPPKPVAPENVVIPAEPTKEPGEEGPAEPETKASAPALVLPGLKSSGQALYVPAPKAPTPAEVLPVLKSSQPVQTDSPSSHLTLAKPQPVSTAPSPTVAPPESVTKDPCEDSAPVEPPLNHMTPPVLAQGSPQSQATPVEPTNHMLMAVRESVSDAPRNPMPASFKLAMQTDANLGTEYKLPIQRQVIRTRIADTVRAEIGMQSAGKQAMYRNTMNPPGGALGE